MSKLNGLSRIPSLDGIRALAALMVMAFHFVGHHGESSQVRHLAVIGQTGVDLFFVLSGFLITRILLSSKDSPHFFRSFYMRRSLRIFPLYYAFLAIYFFLLPFLYATPIPSFSSQIWSWFYLQNVPSTFPGLVSSGPGHFWSLAVEEHFYLIWPLLIFLLPLRHFTYVVFGTLLLPPILRLVFLEHGTGVFYFTLTRMDALAYGALLALLLVDTTIGPSRYIGWFRGLLLALSMLLLPMFAFFSGSGAAWLQTIKLSLIPALFFALIGFCLVDPASKSLTTILSLRGLRWLGSISYGLYVFHPACFEFVQKFLMPTTIYADIAESFLLTIAVASLSFYCLESPIRNLNKRFQYESRSGQKKGLV